MSILYCRSKSPPNLRSMVCTMEHEERNLEPGLSAPRRSRDALCSSKTSNAAPLLHPPLLMKDVQMQGRTSRIIDELYQRSLSLPGTQYELRCQPVRSPIPLRHLETKWSDYPPKDMNRKSRKSVPSTPVQRFHCPGCTEDLSVHSTCLYEPLSRICGKEPTHRHCSATSPGLKTRSVASAEQRQHWSSHSIAFPRGKPNLLAEVDQADRANAALEYKFATWRMYDRIVTHRQKRSQVTPLGLDCHGEDDAVDEDTRRVLNIRTKEAREQQRDQIVPHAAADTPCSSTALADEEIFVMDL